MEAEKSHIIRVDPALVRDNRVLALSVNRQDVDRSVHFIREYGLLVPPVIGKQQDGTCSVLAGEREFMALREMGVHASEVIMVSVNEPEEMDKLALLLSTLKQAPNVLSEGILVMQLLKSGRCTQTQVGEWLGKSVSWVNKRLTLVTRLHPAVREMVTQKQLCAHSAQEIARLPVDMQHAFAKRVSLDGLPKSAVETLVAAYNQEGCPPSLQKQMLEAPRHALEKILENRAHLQKPPTSQEAAPILKELRNNLVLLLRCIRDAEQLIAQMEPESQDVLAELLERCRTRCGRFSSLLAVRLPLSPGTTGNEVTGDAN